jgi:tetratricopeptide (TPR) repeat protein
MYAIFHRPAQWARAFALLAIAMLPPAAGFLRAQAQAPAKTLPMAARPDPDYDLGMQKLQEKAYDDAYDAFRRSHRADPKSTRAIVRMAETLIAQDRAEEAIGLLQVEVRKNPADQELGTSYARTLTRAGFYDQALVHLNQMLKATDLGSPAAGEIYLRMGEAYRGKGDARSALTALNRARDVAPNNVPALLMLALTWDNLGKKDQAINFYREAVKLDGENGTALNNLAFAMMETGGDVDEALKLALRAKQILPESREVRDTVGWAYLKKNQTDVALEMFRPLVEAEPANQNFREHLALAMDQKDDTSPAAEELKTLLRAKVSAETEARIKELLRLRAQ